MLPTIEGFVTASGQQAHGYLVAQPNRNGRASYRYPRKCPRCGGQGGWSGWPGWTCFECGGSGKGADALEPCYTPEGWTRYEAARIKREAKKAAESERAAIRAQVEREEFIESYPVVGWLVALPVEQREKHRILWSLFDQFHRWHSLTPAQIDALIRIRNEIEARAAADAAKANEFIGEPGEKREFELTCCHIVILEGHWGTNYLHICEDQDGRSVVYKGKAGFLAKGETGKVSATIKGHEQYNGRYQTLIARPKVL